MDGWNRSGASRWLAGPPGAGALRRVLASLAVVIIGIVTPSAAARDGGAASGIPIYRVVETDGVDGMETLGHATADFDNDGDVDLLLAVAVPGGHASAGKVVVAHNDGAGSFSIAQDFGFPWRDAFGMVAADFDADGWVDAAVPSNPGGSVIVLKNDGAGTLAESHVIGCGAHVWCLAAGDVNGDGSTDLAATVFPGVDPAGIRLLHGSNRGQFSDGGLIELPIPAMGVGCGDLNGDGVDDIAVWASGKARTFLASPNGEWTAGQVLPVAGQFGGVVISDMNHDDSPDVVAAAAGAQVFLNDGAGSLDPGPTVPYSSLSPSAVDLNGDGLKDLVLSSAVALNDGCGGFIGAWLRFRSDLAHGVEPTGPPRALVAGDFDGDGMVDLAAGGVPTYYVQQGGPLMITSSRLVIATSTGRAINPSPAVVRELQTALDLGVADLNGDGIDDVIGGAGDVGFGSPVGPPRAVFSGFPLAGSVGIGDFDSDGDPDIATAHGLVEQRSGELIPAEYPGAISGNAAAAADFDGDGAIDVMLGSQGAYDVMWGDGTGALSRAITVTVPDTSFSVLRSADLDGDADQDVLSVRLTGVQALLNGGSGAFMVVNVPGANAWDAACGEFNRAEGLEVACGVSGDPTVRIYSIAGGVQLLDEYSYHTPGFEANPWRIHDGDMDGDGTTDLLAVETFANGRVFIGLGNGLGAPEVMQGFEYFLGSPRGARSGDFNGDGARDVAVVNSQGEVGILYGEAVITPGQCAGDVDRSGSVGSADINMVLGAFGCSGGSCPGDANGDGDTDSLDLNVVLAAFGQACP